MTTNQLAAQKLANRIAVQVNRSAGKGLDAARVFLNARVKEALSVPAPRRAVRAGLTGPSQPGKVRAARKKGGILYYVATTPAQVGAPPRKLSSRMRTAQTSRMITPMEAVLGNSAKGYVDTPFLGEEVKQGFNYPAHHELGDSDVPGGGKHPFIWPTVKKWRRHVVKIAGGHVKLK